MPAGLIPKGRTGWKTHGLHSCLALCGVSLCIHFIITAKGNDLAGRESLVDNSCSPCHQLLCVSPFPSRPLLAKPAEGFCCEHGEVISLPCMNGDCKKENNSLSLCLSLCHFSTIRGPKPSLILYFSFFCICIWYLYV